MHMLPQTAGASPRIVVADDDDLLSEVLVSALRTHRHYAVHAPGGILTPDLVANAGLVILDAHIPGVDFRTTLRTIRDAGAEVLVLSGEPTPPLDVPAERYLAKPVDLVVLLDAVSRLTNSGSAA